MAIEQGTETIAVTSQERTWRINIETAKGADPVVTAFREVVKTAADGSVISHEAASSAERKLSTVLKETITVPGTATVLTMAQLAATIAATADQWRTEDIAAASANKAAG